MAFYIRQSKIRTDAHNTMTENRNKCPQHVPFMIVKNNRKIGMNSPLARREHMFVTRPAKRSGPEKI